jgi:hypothetical protein
MEGTNKLKTLLDEVASRALVNKDLAKRLDILTPEARAEDIKRIAAELQIETEIVDNFDLAGIEANSLLGFFQEVQFRFFEDTSFGPER